MIAIVGGGASGALTAYHILRRQPGMHVVIIEPKPQLGLGLAYSTPSLRHLLNVPAGKISALPDVPDHFLQWLRTNHDPDAMAETFAPRAVFGTYIQSLLQETTGIEHVHGKVIDCRFDPPEQPTVAILTLAGGREIEAHRVVLATGNFDPAPLPGVTNDAIETGVYHHNAWDAGTYDSLDRDAPVALIGTGLTTVDVLLRLRELGHCGTITAISRHGVFPYRHERYPALTEPAIPLGTKPTCLAYLRSLRKVIRDGIPWRAVIDSLRSTTNGLWLALPPTEQRRFRRHLQRRWDVVRHRMAPTIADVIETERNTGTLVIRRGHFVGVDIYEGAGKVSIESPAGRQQFMAARVINCTGPSMNYRRVNSPLFTKLFDRGMITAGPLGGGLACNADGTVIDASGKPSPILFNLGPGRLGTLLESIAIPELRQQAFELAMTLTQI